MLILILPLTNHDKIILLLLLLPLLLPPSPPLIMLIIIKSGRLQAARPPLAVKQGQIRELQNGLAGSGMLDQQYLYYYLITYYYYIISINIISVRFLTCFQLCYFVYGDFWSGGLGREKKQNKKHVGACARFIKPLSVLQQQQ